VPASARAVFGKQTRRQQVAKSQIGRLGRKGPEKGRNLGDEAVIAESETSNFCKGDIPGEMLGWSKAAGKSIAEFGSERVAGQQ
jgi:hypothetical protein